jgi:hypothetical protein
LPRRASPELRVTRAFFDRPDGSFELLDVPHGELFFVAASPDSSGSEVLPVKVSAGGTTEIELLLPDPVPGRGQVVSAATGAPVHPASVYAFTMGAGMAIEKYGTGHPVTLDGRFELPFLRPGLNSILVEAPNYAQVMLSAPAVDGVVDFGRIELRAPLDLRVEVQGSVDLGALRLRVVGPERRSGLTFVRESAEVAALVLEDLSPGYYELVLERNNAAQDSLYLDIGQGKLRPVRFLAGGGGDLLVRVDNEAGMDLAGAALVLDYTTMEGHLAQRYASLEQGATALVQSLPPGNSTVVLISRQGETHGSTKCVVRSGAQTEVVLRISKRSVRLRLVDEDAHPIGGARVMLQPAFGGVSARNAHTDSGGEALFQSVAPGLHLATAWHTSLGMVTNAAVDVAPAEEESLHEVVLLGNAGFRLLVQDGVEPLGHVGVLLANSLGTVVSGEERHTASNGTLEQRLLGAGTYRALLTRPDAWPMELDVQAREDLPLYSVQMRRLGDLELQVRNSHGIAVSGVIVELTDVESESSLQDWLEQGKVDAPGGLRSDSHGKIEVQRLPRGTYRWSLPEHGLEGVLTVAPGETAEVPLAIGE